MTEKQLIAKCLQKDQSAMTELFNRYASSLKSTCIRLINDPQIAKDVFQEGFIEIFQNLAKFEYRSSLYTWMNRIMINKSLAYLRKSTLNETIFDLHSYADIADETEISDDFECSLNRMSVQDVLEKLSSLPEKYRIVLNLYAIDGLKHAEISEKLGITINQSKKILSRARFKLTELIYTKKNETARNRHIASK